MSAGLAGVIIGRTGIAVRAVVAGFHSRASPILEEFVSNGQSSSSSSSTSTSSYPPPKTNVHSPHLRTTKPVDAVRNHRHGSSRFRQSTSSTSGGNANSGNPGGTSSGGSLSDSGYLSSSSSDDSSNVTKKCESSCKRRFLAVRCGFAKDMLFKASTVRDQDHYGDDACFVAKHKIADVVGVADGVGGWRLYGIDPSAFSRSLMSKCAELVESGEFQPNQPAQLLATAYAHMKFMRSTQTKRLRHEQQTQQWRGGNDKAKPSAMDQAGQDIIIGSSTACVVVLDKANSQMHAANLGDSGFIVVRNGRVVHRSEEQCHYFNAPYQLTLPPPAREGDSSFLCDSPESAHTFTFNVLDGDLVLVATDGLYDNMPTELIERELSNLDASASEAQLQCACNSIALQARRLSQDAQFVSPFARRAREHGFHATGGKPDDITIVLVAVTREHARNCDNKQN